MIYPSMQQLLFAALCLVIPIAIVLSHRHPSGPIVICSWVAFAAFGVFWLLLGGVNSPTRDAPGHILMSILTFFGGILLLLAAWVLALNAASEARRWGWVALLTIATYLSALAIIFSITQSDPCIFG